MIRPVTTDYDFIITDSLGDIDSFTSGIGSLLNLSPFLFKDQNKVNIQIIAPELISVFEYRKIPSKEEENKEEDGDIDYRRFYKQR